MGQKVKGKIDREAFVYPNDEFGVQWRRVMKAPIKPVKLKRGKPDTDDLTPRGNLPKRSLPSGYQAKGKKPGQSKE